MQNGFVSQIQTLAGELKVGFIFLDGEEIGTDSFVTHENGMAVLK